MKLLIPSPRETTSHGVKRKDRDEAEEDSLSGEGNPKKRYKTRAYRRRQARGIPKTNPLKQNRADYQPDCQFYYPDADLIILSEGIMFGVHAEKMRKAGGIFEALLSSPEIKAQAEDMLYDLPCIDVPLINSRQLRFLIAYLYDKM
jgi:hypothetical protein